MECKDALNTLGVWMDNELSKDASAALKQHIAQCPECAAEAKNLQKLMDTLNRIRPEGLPRGLMEKTLYRYGQATGPRERTPLQGQTGWIRKIGLVAGSMAGLWTGCVLGMRLVSGQAFSPLDLMAALCFSGGLASLWT